MVVLGVILLIIGYFTGIQILWVAGLILLVVGLVFLLLGGFGRPVAGRRYWF